MPEWLGVLIFFYNNIFSDPLAHYFSTQSNIHLTVAADSSRDGQRLAALGDNIESIVVDVQKEPDIIDKLIG